MSISKAYLDDVIKLLDELVRTLRPLREAASDILPCPFCGETARLRGMPDSANCYEVQVQCDDCDAQGPPQIVEADDDAAERREAAISAWNGRADLPTGYKWICDYEGEKTEAKYRRDEATVDASIAAEVERLTLANAEIVALVRDWLAFFDLRHDKPGVSALIQRTRKLVTDCEPPNSETG